MATAGVVEEGEVAIGRELRAVDGLGDREVQSLAVRFDDRGR